jgi:hypothetical protein
MNLFSELLPWPLVCDTIEYGRWDYHCGSYVLLLVIPDFVHASVEGRFSGDGTVSLSHELTSGGTIRDDRALLYENDIRYAVPLAGVGSAMMCTQLVKKLFGSFMIRGILPIVRAEPPFQQTPWTDSWT